MNQPRASRFSQIKHNHRSVADLGVEAATEIRTVVSLDTRHGPSTAAEATRVETDAYLRNRPTRAADINEMRRQHACGPDIKRWTEAA